MEKPTGCPNDVYNLMQKCMKINILRAILIEFI